MSLSLTKNLNILDDHVGCLLPIPNNDSIMVLLKILNAVVTDGSNQKHYQTVENCLDLSIKIYNFVNTTIIKEIRTKYGLSSDYHSNLRPDSICIKTEYSYGHIIVNSFLILQPNTYNVIFNQYEFLKSINKPTDILFWICHKDVRILCDNNNQVIALLSEHGFIQMYNEMIYIIDKYNYNTNMSPSCDFNNSHVSYAHCNRNNGYHISKNISFLCLDCAPNNCIQLRKPNILIPNVGYKVEYVFYNYKTNRYIINKYLCVKKISETKYVCYDHATSRYAMCEYANSNECVICYNQLESKNAIVPCGHTNLCDKCYNKMNNTSSLICPTCRTPITNFVRLYM